jgi:hypothetical protein
MEVVLKWANIRIPEGIPKLLDQVVEVRRIPNIWCFATRPRSWEAWLLSLISTLDMSD